MQQFFAGDTIKVDYAVEFYSNTEWAAQLLLKRDSFSQDYTGASYDEGWQTVISSADSAGLTAGVYDYFVRLTNTASGDVVTADRGKLLIFADPASASGSTKTQYELDLDAVEDAMRKMVEGGAVKRYRIQTVAGEREPEKMSLDQLRSHHKWLLGRLNWERSCRGLKPLGGNQYKTIQYCAGGRGSSHRRRPYGR